MRRYTPEAEAWLRANYGGGDVHDTVDAFAARFGWRPTPQALYQKAYKLGLVKRPKRDETRTVERRIVWSAEPEMDGWMRENDRGHSIAAVQDAFEERFGFRPAKMQVSQWRAKNGIGRNRNKGRVYDDVPIGTERDSGKGYVLVKVAERATVPMSKDNWRMKHHIVWEEAHGRPVPDGHEVVFADHDTSNFDLDNLVAVDKKVVGIINSQGLDYWDAESLRVAAARARLMSAVRDAESGGPRECGVCGAVFEPTAEQARYPKPVQTCPACRALGKKAKGTPKRTYRRVCAVCHAEFDAPKVDQRRCPECIARCPKLGVRQQSQRERV